MADFNAGSIEGHLEMDTHAFYDGLRKARQDAADFEKKPIRPRIELDTSEFDSQREKLKNDFKELDHTLHAKVNLDITDALAKIAAVKLAMSSLSGDRALGIAGGSGLVKDAERVGGSVERDLVDAAEGRDRAGTAGWASRFFGYVGRQSLNPFDSKSGLGKILDLGGVGGAVARGTLPALGMAARPALMVGGGLGVASLLPSLAAATAGLGVFATAAASAGAVLDVAFKGYSALVKNDISDLKKNPQKYGALGAQFLAQQKAQGKAQDALQAATLPGVIGVMGAASGLETEMLPKLVPIINTISHGVRGIILDITHLTQTKLFEHFLDTVQHFLGGFLKAAGPDLVKLLSAFMHGFIALQPILHDLGHFLGDLFGKFDSFTNKLANGNKLQGWAHDLGTTLKPVWDMLKGVAEGLWGILKAIAPVRAPFLEFVGALAKAIGGLDWKDLAIGVGAIFKAVSPLIPVFGELVNTLLKPLSALLANLSTSVLGPLTHSLGAELAPAFASIEKALMALVPYIGQFLGSIANLVNPTGVALLTTLIKDLLGAVVALAPVVLEVGTLIENVLDSALTSALPIIDAVAKTVGFLATALGDVLGPLAHFLTTYTPLLQVLGYSMGVWLALVAVTKTYNAVNSAMIGLLQKVGLVQKETAAATGVLTIGERTYTVATADAEVATRGLSAALLLSPWSTVVVAVGAAVAAYKLLTGSSRNLYKPLYDTTKLQKNLDTAFKNAKSPIDALTYSMDTYANAIGVVNGKLGINNKLQAEKDALASLNQPTIAQLAKYGVSLTTYTSALAGNKTALAQISAGLGGLKKHYDDLATSAHNTGTQAIQAISAIQGKLKDVTNSDTGGTGIIGDSLAGQVRKVLAKLPTLGNSSVTKLRAGLLAELGSNGGYEEQSAAISALTALEKAYKGVNDAQNGATHSAATNSAALKTLIDNINSSRAAQDALKESIINTSVVTGHALDSMGAAGNRLKNNWIGLSGQFINSKPNVDALVTSFTNAKLKIGQARTALELLHVPASLANRVIAQLKDSLTQLPNKKTVTLEVQAAAGKVAQTVLNAFGPGVPFGGVFGTTQPKAKPARKHAYGGTTMLNGLELVGEQGPEFIDLPAGTHVTPAAQSRQMMDDYSNEHIGLLRQMVAALSKPADQNGDIVEKLSAAFEKAQVGAAAKIIQMQRAS